MSPLGWVWEAEPCFRQTCHGQTPGAARQWGAALWGSLGRGAPCGASCRTMGHCALLWDVAPWGTVRCGIMGYQGTKPQPMPNPGSALLACLQLGIKDDPIWHCLVVWQCHWCPQGHGDSFPVTRDGPGRALAPSTGVTRDGAKFLCLLPS